MALEKIVINVSGQADLDSTIKKLVELGSVDEKNAKQFTDNSKKIQNENKKTESSYSGLKNASKDFLNSLPGAQHVQQITNLANGINLSTNAAGGMSKALNVLKIALASTGIGALVVALGSLFAYFKKTEAGSEMLERGLAKIGAAVNVIISKFANLGKGIVQLFSGEWKQAVETFKHAFDDIGKDIGEAVTKAGEFTQALQDIEDAEKLMSVRIAETRNEIQRLLIESRNRTKTEAERLALLQQAEQLEKQIISDQIALQQKKVDALKEENKLKVKTGELDAGNKTDELIAAEIELSNLRGNSLELLEKIRLREDLLLDQQKERAEKEKGYWEMRRRHMAEDLDISTKSSEEELKAFDANANIKKKFDEQYFKSKEEQRKKDEAANQAVLDRDYQEAKAAKEKKEQLNQAYTDFAIDNISKVAQFAFDNEKAKIDNDIHNLGVQTDAEIKAIDARNKAGLISDELAAAQKEALKKKQAQKEIQLRQKQAQAEKNNALFQIAITTAVNAVKAITLGPQAVALAIATGAIEAALVQARPLPQFKKGGFTGEGNPNETAGIVHKSEFVMPADKTSKYRSELEAMYNGNYREPIRLRQSLTDARNDNMAENIYKSMLLNGQFDDRNIVNAISKNGKVKIGNGSELANQIASKIADRTSEKGLFS